MRREINKCNIEERKKKTRICKNFYIKKEYE